MKIFIAGATGFIGSYLAKGLAAANHEITALTRNGSKAREILGNNIKIVVGDPKTPGPWQDEIDGTDAVINLVGDPVLPKRWTKARKQVLLDSRLKPTRMIAEAISKASKKPTALLSGSAISYYGDQGDKILTEEAGPGAGFSATMCRDWENEAAAVKEDVRVVYLRTSFVLGRGGSLPRLVGPFKMWAGGPMGSGDQYLPWIHIDDYLGLTKYILAHQSITGAVNMAAAAATNRDFSATLGGVLNRPSWLRVPALAIKLMLGEGSVILLESQRLVPKKALDAGYKFRFPDLKAALTDVLAPR